MGRLRQTAIWRSRTGAALPRPLHPSRRHLQPSIARIRGRQRHVPLEGLRSRKCATHDDPFRTGVYSPVLAARAPEALCPHPTLRLHGQLPAFHFVPTLSSTVENGAGSSFTGNRSGNFGAGVSYLSDAIDCRREINGRSDCLEIRFEMLCRYVVGKIPNRTDDVLPHALGDVRLHAPGPSRSRLIDRQQLSKTHQWTPRIRLRRRRSALVTYLPVTTSTRIPVLSP
jgi:hypothetical protein